MQTALSCLPRPSYGDARAYTHSFEVPSYKVARSCLTSTCDHLRVARKLLPAAVRTDKFQLCERLWFFGFMRMLQVTNQEHFLVLRSDMARHLMPHYQRLFAEYTTVFNPNFVETMSLLDAGLGLSFDWKRFDALMFETWHQRAKWHASKGTGVPISNVHSFLNVLLEKDVLSMDFLMTTLGRIPPTKFLRRFYTTTPATVFRARYSKTMLGPGHESLPRTGYIPRRAGVFPATNKQRPFTKRKWGQVPCACWLHAPADKRALLHIARSWACRERLKHPAAHRGAPRNAGGHQWTPPGFPLLGESAFPHDLVEQMAGRLLHALSRGIVTFKVG